MPLQFHLNQRLSYTPGPIHSAARCTVRYIGTVEGTKGEWIGVEWDQEGKGKHSGEYGGKKYFDCKILGTGSFIRTTRQPDHSISFLEGLKKKYTTVDDPPEPHAVLSISASKVIEEVGFDKILEKLAQLKELRVVLLDGLNLATADDVDEIRKACPKIEELDLSRNLFENLQTVASICSALPNLKSLRIGGNRFSSLDITLAEGQPSPFAHITSLEISDTLFSWEDTTQILSSFPLIHTLESSLNRITTIPTTISLPTTITTINLERNAFTTLSSCLPLTTLPNLTRLILAHNEITTILPNPSTLTKPFPLVTHLDLSFNQLPTFSHLDLIPPLFPALTSLRISHNPYCNLLPMEEAHMLTVARFPEQLRMLNHSTITGVERSNAEMYYLSRIAKELAAVGETEHEKVLAGHKRWGVLCELHGAPQIDRAAELLKRNLAANLLELEFTLTNTDAAPITKKIPKALPISTLKALLGRMFGVEPLGLRLELIREVEEELVDNVWLEDGIKEVGYYVERKAGRILVMGKK